MTEETTKTNGNSRFRLNVNRELGTNIKTIKEAMVQAALSILDGDDLVYSLRQLYYRLVAKFGLINNKSSYGALSDYLARAREDGRIPWDRMEDRTRSLIEFDLVEDDSMPYWSFTQRIKHVIGWQLALKAKNNKWRGQKYIVSAAIEKASLIGVMTAVAESRNVTTCAFQGYSSVDHLRNLTNQWNKIDPTHDEEGNSRNLKAVVVVYAGDYDPEGKDIPRAAIKWLRNNSGRKIFVHKVGLNKRQIRRLNLPEGQVKKKSSRALKWLATHENKVYEVDAIEIHDLIDLYSNTIDIYFDKDVETQEETARIEREKDLREKGIERFKPMIEEAKDFLENGIEEYIKSQYGYDLD